MTPKPERWSRSIPVLYLAFGLAWILGSDEVIGWLFGGNPRLLLLASTVKGFAFVMLTALLLAVWWRNQQRRTDALTREAAKLQDESRLELERSRNQLQEVINANVAVAYAFDREGRTLFMNSSCYRLLGITPQQGLGRTRNELMAPQDAEAHRAVDLRIFESGNSEVVEETLGTGGGQRVFLSVKYPMRDLEGYVYAVGGVSTDITELRQTQRQLLEVNARLEATVEARTSELVAARDRAEQADRAKTAFLSTISHELRTPLNSMIGFTDIVLEGMAGPLNPEQQHQLQMARESAGQLLDLINEILDLSRMEAGRMQFVIEAFDPADALEHAVDSLRMTAERKKLSLMFDHDGSVRHMLSDRRRVVQIVTNLLSNAVKFTQTGGIFVRLRGRDATWIDLTVEDTGPGISEEDLARLFKPFVQVGAASRPRAEGTGLGLTIARHLAHALGGEIAVASVPGKGTTFTVSLPVEITHEVDSSGSGLFRVLT